MQTNRPADAKINTCLDAIAALEGGTETGFHADERASSAVAYMDHYGLDIRAEFERRDAAA